LGVGFAVIFVGLKGVGTGFEGGLAGLEDAVFGAGAAFVCTVYAGDGVDVGGFGIGFEAFVRSAADGAVFVCCSRN
jgi:hypothetical protein